MDNMTTSMVAFTPSIDGVPMPKFVCLDRKYICGHCLQPLNQPRQLPCGHRVCKPCVDELYSMVGNGSGITCPLHEEDCETNITSDNVFPDFSAQREMRKFHVYCLFKDHGCNQTMAWAQYKAHIDQCKYRLQRCKFCRNEIPLEQLQLQNHLDKDCPMVHCECPFGCSVGPFVRSELNEHLEQCLLKPRPCPLQIVGCPFKGTQEQLNAHKYDNWHHIKVLCDRIASGQQLMGATSGTSQEQDLDVRETVRQFEETNCIELDNLKRHQQSVESQLSDMLSQVNSLLVSTSNDHEIVQLKGRILQLERTTTASLPSLQEVQRLFQQLNDEIDRLRYKVMNLDSRCKYLEVAGHDGVLLWKISSFRKHFQSAKHENPTSLYSPPFYATRYGYKMFARTYLNGDGIGRGTHISLYFVIMKGEYDDLLPWPFTADVTFSLIDQSQAGEHHSKTFRPDQTSSSFQQPTSVMNVPSGYPQFISHGQLIDGAGNAEFLKNDTIYFRVVVNMSEIRFHKRVSRACASAAKERQSYGFR